MNLTTAAAVNLQAYFKDEAGSQFGTMLSVPQPATISLQWILSSSGGCNAIVARYGLGLDMAKFLIAMKGYR